jgi:ribose 5-phosphate isomerase
MKDVESVTDLSSTDARNRERGYTITSEGNVIVDVHRLLKSPKAKRLAEKARGIVMRNQKPRQNR